VSLKELVSRLPGYSDREKLTDIPNNPRQLNIRDKILRIQKLCHFVPRQTLLARHLHVYIFISDCNGLAELGR
jgi:hypothetical protein